MGGGGGWNPFQDVSWSRPFGGSALGNAIQGDPNAPLTSTGVVKATGEQLVPDYGRSSQGEVGGETGASFGLPTRDPAYQQSLDQQAAMQAQSAADTAAQKKARQDEADAFTKSFTGAQGSQKLQQSLQGLQDQARRMRGRRLDFGG